MTTRESSADRARSASRSSPTSRTSTCVVVPVGGGGLIAGIAIAVKALSPKTEVIGVETELYPSMWAALRGLPAKCGGESLAEGIAVKNVGKLTLEIARPLRRRHGAGRRRRAIEQAVADYLMLQKTMAEGAGAAGLAAVLADPDRFRGKRVGLILAGGNIDPRLAASIMVRELARERADRRGAPPHQRPARRPRRHRRDHRRERRQHPRGAASPHDAERAAEGRERRRDDRDARCRTMPPRSSTALAAKGYRVERLDPPEPGS